MILIWCYYLVSNNLVDKYKKWCVMLYCSTWLVTLWTKFKNERSFFPRELYICLEEWRFPFAFYLSFSTFSSVFHFLSVCHSFVLLFFKLFFCFLFIFLNLFFLYPSFLFLFSFSFFKLTQNFYFIHYIVIILYFV